MPIKVVCQACGANIQAHDAVAGKRVKCPKCAQSLRMPGGWKQVPSEATAGSLPTTPQPANRSAAPIAPLKPVNQRVAPLLLGGGVLFVMTITAVVGIAWGVLSQRTPQSPPAKEEVAADLDARLREQRLQDRVEQLEREKQRQAEAEADRLRKRIEQLEREAAAKQGPLLPDAIFARCSPAVVKVETRDQQGRSSVFGSGFLVGAKGLIVTNHHVIEKADAADVVLADKTKLAVLGVVALDQEADLAILKVDGQVRVRSLELADNNLPAIGTRVYAIGNPKGFTRTLSDGLVSAHREEGRAGKLRIAMIQTTAPISPGSSGGPLLTADGKVVGVTTSGFIAGAQNLNFAVPVSNVSRLLLRCDDEEQLTTFPLVRQAVAGYQGQELFKPETLQRANQAITDIEQQFGKTVAVETFDTVPENRIKEFGELDKDGRLNFFGEWARSRAIRNRIDGVYILICLNPPHLQLEVDNKTIERGFTQANRNELLKLLLEKFRAKEFDEGLLAGIEFVRRTLQANLGTRPPDSANEWPPQDVENASHFARAIRVANEAWTLCENSGYAGRPWLMTDADRRKFARLIGEANREARLVRKDVLRRMHPLLPEALKDFITATHYIGPNALARQPNPRVAAVWRHWTQWVQANQPDVRIPDAALR